MLPLIYSRIWESLLACPLAMQAAAEELGPRLARLLDRRGRVVLADVGEQFHVPPSFPL